MAILAPPDWQYSPRDAQMDAPTKSSSPNNNSSTPPPNTQQSQSQSSSSQRPPPQQQQHQQQQQQPYPFQQQPQGNWTPSLAAAPFYPGAFYGGPMSPPQGVGAYPPPTNPYFDPANAQLAQWAYQQMMFQQGQHAMQQQHPQHPQHPGTPDFFSHQPAPAFGQFNPFPSGTPPPRQEGPPSNSGSAPGNNTNPGFHPYRRPTRQQSAHSQAPSTQSQSGHSHAAEDWRQETQDWRPQPPYSRPDASGSSSSVNSHNSGRPRTNSNNSARERGPDSHSRADSHSPRGSPSPVPSTKGTSSNSNSSTPPPPRIPHHRASSGSSAHSTGSGSGSSSNNVKSSSASSTSKTSGTPSSAASKTARPSPLSQGTVTATNLPAARPSTSSMGTTTRAERRISRDDSSLALSSLSLLATRAEAASANGPVKGSGLKGRLRRALSFNASVALKEEDDGDSDSDESIKASVVNPGRAATAKTPAVIRSAVRPGGGAAAFPPPSSATPSSKKSRAASLFNSRLNASTDNISLSSTVSSASVMIRKLGSMGRIARRNSLAGITGLFKDRDKKRSDKKKGKEKDKDKKKKDKDKEKDKKKAGNGKGEASEASVSHATAELEVGDWSVPEGAMAGVGGLSPAARLARQHTLKSNAEAAAKAREAKARQEAIVANANAANAANAGTNGVNGVSHGVPTWDRNTATRSPGRGTQRVGEDGTRVFVEDSESDEEGGYDDRDAYGDPHQQQWDDEDDEEWGLLGGEEDDTIRLGDAQGAEEYDGEHEPWATDVRRSVERTRVPAKGILKHAGTYDQATYSPEAAHALAHGNPSLRARSNSYNSVPQTNELGPLARIPSPDPDHIDGLHRHGSHSSQHGDTNTAAKRSSVPSLPPLAFESGSSIGFDSPQATPTAATYAQAAQQQSTPTNTTGANAIFNHPGFNSSAPALTTLGLGHPAPAPLAHRAVTAPPKKLAFASNLSVYDTFSANMYDRRSEPATWSRLTPALAQRIKEELNSYKMEEMEVHAASRIQCVAVSFLSIG
ncbi:hypothetical protein C8R43DRAFT_874460 [Mycena crocata]|nr:hypothetical protein C8R43DRAFT_874460 [Mycena crocata]